MKNKFQLMILAFVSMPVIAVAVLSITQSFEHKDLPVVGHVPKFSMTERSGEEIGDAFLKGKVWVAGFIFTHCEGQCPIIHAKMKELQRQLLFKDKFRLISFTVDPKRDTPAKLSELANRLSADPYKWLFLTGTSQAIHDLVQGGFKLSQVEDAAVPEDITHSSKLALVDGERRIRGYYDANEESEMKKLLKDTRRLIRETY